MSFVNLIVIGAWQNDFVEAQLRRQVRTTDASYAKIIKWAARP